ncbi:nitrate/sulfonate/bicarbonate ABC transporter permease [Acetobacter indonesiensis NRIC 0313]|uniref:ABC transporter nitrate permease n=2 Tax=Acetobacter indonesiensis TaxID=104101 RepID=A0A6N3T9D3_9PROT|nr:ABC transporter permease subunit [Acetobacter indonesiensis]GAN64482.1 ABC transporter nitrate permease [Acetobacter indonesiensis]GBQ55261.1 nitrate/sulfonate/bicarbonate ABC transporter permease [Acetobacter indonesiensis NRIC 0313]GEN04219.1 nitrate ABC transporter, permease protein [Acetobacter indonesiensis]
MMSRADHLKGVVLSLILALILLFSWQYLTESNSIQSHDISAENREYEILMGHTQATQQPDHNFPSPRQFALEAWQELKAPFHNTSTNDRGIGWQLGASLYRVIIGYGLAVLVAVPLGLLLGQQPILRAALNPFIQILRPISPLAWMPIALYTIKNAEECGIFVIFICSVWPILLNTSFGVSRLRKEWLDVAKTLELGWARRLWLIILPASAPTIVTGMRVGLGIAWLAIIAAEMLVGSSGIGYFVWNQWNNLSISNVILAVLLIGITGMILDTTFAALQRRVSYAE